MLKHTALVNTSLPTWSLFYYDHEVGTSVCIYDVLNEHNSGLGIKDYYVQAIDDPDFINEDPAADANSITQRDRKSVV